MAIGIEMNHLWSTVAFERYCSTKPLIDLVYDLDRRPGLHPQVMGSQRCSATSTFPLVGIDAEVNALSGKEDGSYIIGIGAIG